MLGRFAAAPDAAMLLPLMNGDAAYGEVRGGFRLVNGPVELGAGVERRIGNALYRDDRAVVDARFRFQEPCTAPETSGAVSFQDGSAAARARSR